MPRCDPEADRLFVQSLARGLKVLEAFTPDRDRLTLTDLARLTGLGMAAVQRYTHTLTCLGYLSRGRHKEFRLGPGVLSLGYSSLRGSELRKLAEAHLGRFSREVGFSVNLGVLQDREVLILYRHEMARFFKFDLEAGSRLPAHCSAMGKLLLAALPVDELRDLLSGVELEPVTPLTLTNRRALERELGLIRQRRWAASDGEASLGLYSLAVPVLDRESRVVAALNLSLPRLEGDDKRRQHMLERLFKEGRHFSRQLGYCGDYPLIPTSLAAETAGLRRKRSGERHGI